MVLARLAWRNLWRQKRRSLITAVAMAVAVALSMASMTMNAGVYGTLFRVMVEQQLGHAQLHQTDYHRTRQLHDTVHEADATLAALEARPEVASAAAKLNGFGLIGGRDKSVGGQLVGISPGAQANLTRVDETVVQGRYLAEEPANEILLGVGLAKQIAVGVGDSVVVVTQAADGSLGNDVYDVVGLVKTGAAQLDRSGTYLHLHDLQRLLTLDDQVHQIHVLAHDASDLEGLKQALVTAAPDDTEVLTWKEASPSTAQMMDMQVAGNMIVLGIVFAVASFGVLNTMMMSVFERTRELGVLKAIGMRPGRMVQMVVFESLMLAAVAGAIGLGLGGLLNLYLVKVGIDFSGGNEEGLEFMGVQLDPTLRGQVDPGGIVMVVVALLVVSALASLYPAWRAARLVPVEALRASE